jgi:hypothetical protein
MSLVALRDAIVESIESNISTFRAVQGHGGRFSLEEIKRVSLQEPSCLVAVFGGRTRRIGGVCGLCDAEVVAFIITKGSSVSARDRAAPALAEAVAQLAIENTWGCDFTKAPEDGVMINNLYLPDIDRHMVSLWSVSWTQQVEIGTFDLTTLDDFNRLNVQTDIADRDGVIEHEFDIFLNGTLMSAYGRAYISSALATSIAVADTYQKVAGTTTLVTSPVSVYVDMPSNNRLRHTGTASKPFMVEANVSVEVSADAKVTFAFAKNGTVDETAEAEEELTLAGGAESISLKSTLDLDENDYIELWVKADDTVNVTVNKMSLVIVAS